MNKPNGPIKYVINRGKIINILLIEKCFEFVSKKIDKLFDKNDIHPSVKGGMGVLAKLYIRVLHSRHFDPYVYQ